MHPKLFTALFISLPCLHCRTVSSSKKKKIIIMKRKTKMLELLTARDDCLFIQDSIHLQWSEVEAEMFKPDLIICAN